ncbi:GTP-binding nuclear protein gsp1/Ran [Aspergillus melleus]|uniref:GTP-binding nuclear protein gsp1/Ran n=1 Tax=Aspergillus melleus TaxID=138277 RepID=A0ACC3BAA2_9EURO|nr:GTP-binding nuclear protein gsp1/Ran [Aspergillus melleus]
MDVNNKNMASSEVHDRTFKLVLLGDAAVGKAGRGNGRGSVNFEIWDIAGDQGPLNRLGEYLQDTDAAIIMFDVSRWKTWESVGKWYHTPVVVCGNKVDDQCEREVKPEDISWPDEMGGVQYYETSIKTNLNIDQPFLWLTRTLLNDQSLCHLLTLNS